LIWSHFLKIVGTIPKVANLNHNPETVISTEAIRAFANGVVEKSASPPHPSFLSHTVHLLLLSLLPVPLAKEFSGFSEAG